MQNGGIPLKKEFGLKQLILLTVFYLLFVLIDLSIDHFTGIHWTSSRDFNNVLGLVALGLLWIWYFVDQIRKK